MTGVDGVGFGGVVVVLGTCWAVERVWMDVEGVDGCGGTFVGTRTRHRARGVEAHDFLVSRNLSPFLRVP